MDADIRLDGNTTTAEGDIFKTTANDLILDAPARHTRGGSTMRRALVHDFTDGLTINWAHDYPGGVTINGPLQILGNVNIKGNLTVESRFGTRPITEVFAAYDQLIEGMTKRVKLLEKHVKLEG